MRQVLSIFYFGGSDEVQQFSFNDEEKSFCLEEWLLMFFLKVGIFGVISIKLGLFLQMWKTGEKVNPL